MNMLATEKNSRDSERALLNNLAKGDLKAFDLFYYRYESKVSRFCKNLLKDDDASKDVVQQVFIKLWETRDKLCQVKNPDAYLFTISKNLVYNQMRRKVYEFAFRNYYRQTTKYLINSTEMEVDFNEVSLLINKAVDKLPPKRKHIFELSRYKGLNNKEIAKSLNTSTSFVENQINKALKTLKNQIRYKEILGLVICFIGGLW